MSRTTMQSLVSLAFLSALAAPVAHAQVPVPPAAQAAPEQQLFTVEELDNLLAPVALYPDPILAQLLVAATYPDQVALAARYVREYGQQGIDDQAWDVSVKAIAHYAPVLNMLDKDPDWMTALGQAYAIQEGDVMASVQGLRRMAHAQGNLVSTAEQTVQVEPAHIRIIPAQPRVIYVPVYEPEIVYYRPVFYAHSHSPYWSFGIGFPIGVWLTYDFDWGHRVVYYHGWDGYGRYPTWYHVSRPFITFNTIYVNRYRTVVIVNRRVIDRRVNYGRFDRYNGVHRRVTWDRRGLPGRHDGDRSVVNANRSAQPRGEGNRITPTRVGGNTRPATSSTAQPERRDVTRGTTTRSTTTRGTTTRGTTTPSTSTRPSGSGTWNARPSQERRATPERTVTPDRASTQSRRTIASAPRQVTPASVPRSAPERASVPRASVPQRTSAPRASAPQRTSAPRASAPQRTSAPRASAPSRSSAPSRASAPSRGNSSSAPAERSSRKRGD